MGMVCNNCKQWQELWEEEINLAQHQRGRDVFLRDEKIFQQQRKQMRIVEQSQMNMLKSILAETIGPEKVDQLLKDHWHKYYTSRLKSPTPEGEKGEHE